MHYPIYVNSDGLAVNEAIIAEYALRQIGRVTLPVLTAEDE